ncbi:MAG: thioredoxin family protein [Proteobacteria bacterium]|nr:thioredoxin family protein [Pseudomonadota bacterium]
MTWKKNIKVAGVFFILIIWIDQGMAAAPSESDKSIKWYSYNEGMRLGKQEGKKIFITFHANWCGYCKKMDQITFSNKDVIDYISNNYIAVKVNSDQEKQLAANYQVSGLPTHWFLDASGENITKLPGYMTPEQFLPILKYIQTDSYKTIKFDEFVKNSK